MNNPGWPRLALSVLVVALVAICGVSAQQPQKQQPQNPATKPPDKGKPTTEPQEPQTIVSETINVRLPLSVVDKSGHFITNLKQTDFEIFEDKVQQRIESFVQESDLPLDVAILMDTSNSVRPKLKFEQDAAVSFLQTMLTTRKDRALFATFDSQVELHQDFTNRLELLSKAIDGVKARGETRFYDAVYRVCEEKMSAQGRRRAMVIITDGDDTASERTLNQAIDIAQRSETVIYLISTKQGGFFGVQAGMVDAKEDKEIKRMAEETGGRAFFTSSVIDLEKSFTAIAKELRSQYLIAYAPSNEKPDNKFRQIEVKLPGYKDFRIRTKKGYTALPRSISASK
jgi:Ca-activated chloride channel homolog